MRTLAHAMLVPSFLGLLGAGGIYALGYYRAANNVGFDNFRVVCLIFGATYSIGVIFSLCGIITSRVQSHSVRFQFRSRAPGYETQTTSPALKRVDSTLNFLSLFLPARIMKEDAGDAREVIDKLAANSAPTWMIYTKLASSVCWILLAAAREVLTVTKKKPN